MVTSHAKLTYLAVVDVDLALGAGEALLADAREAGDAVHARRACRARVRLALIDIDGTILSYTIKSIINSLTSARARAQRNYTLRDNNGTPTGKALHASALEVVLQVLAGAAVFARRRQALVDVLLAAVSCVACPHTTQL